MNINKNTTRYIPKSILTNGEMAERAKGKNDDDFRKKKNYK